MQLVTGGAGFIGSHIVEQLVANGQHVRVIDNLLAGCMDNLAGVLDRVEFIERDLRDDTALRSAMRDVDVVFHQAADASVPRSMSDPAACYDVNVMGTLRLLEAARNVGVRRVVFASSCAVYGEEPESPKREPMPSAPASPYAASKVAGEDLCALYGRVFGLETVRLRYFNVFGPRQSPFSAYAPVIPRFISAFANGAAPAIYGDGEQTRDFVYVDDVVRANLLAANATGANGRVFNIASGRSVSLNQVVTHLQTIMGSTIEAQYVEQRPGDIRHSAADISAALEIGFRAAIPFADGLSRTVRALTG